MSDIPTLGSKPVIIIEGFFTQRFDYDANNNAIYVGRAKPGTASTDAFWQIQRLTYNANNLCTLIEWANSRDLFDSIWDNRASLTYG